MVKSYLRYLPAGVFGVIASTHSNVVYDHSGKFAVAPALEDVIVWDLKKGSIIRRWHESENKAEVTCIMRSPIQDTFAVGYDDGSIRLWNLHSDVSIVTFNGHRGAVTALCFDASGSRLASGGKDTDIIIWDVVGEMGLHRLKGHKDQVTSLHFISTKYPHDMTPTHIISSSKDTLVKLWDLSTTHCVETLVAHRAEVWSMDLRYISSEEAENDSLSMNVPIKSSCMLVTGGADSELKVWKLDLELAQKLLDSPDSERGESDSTNMAIDGEIQRRAITFYGSLQRQSKDRVVTLQFHPNGKYFAVQAADKVVEIFKIRTGQELKKKLNRRRKRIKEKISSKANDGSNDIGIDDSKLEVTLADEISSFQVIRTHAKARSFDFQPLSLGKNESTQFLLSLSNNSLEAYSLHNPPKSRSSEPNVPSKLHAIDLPGHRGDVRTLALSSDDEMLVTAGTNLIKVWNVRTGSCIRSMECGYALCAAFVPGNRFIIIGTKSGALELYSLSSSTLVESIQAHSGALWTLQIRPDKRGLVTGSADKDVKFWDFAMVKDDDEADESPSKISNEKSKTRLTLIHMRTLKMTDEVLCVRYSPNQNLIAVSLLDATVKVFYHDTLKFFLSLYGHKLPVLSMDISSDNSLLVTSSADKNVKLWGLDFGDCHKSIFAHDDSIMHVQFVWGTHYFFTASKDKTIKYWDGDKFENIMKLEGHQSEVWALAIAKYGNFVASTSHDRSIRIWEKTDEQLFLEEEREREMDDIVESALTNENADSEEASKPTVTSLKAGERILEALELAESEETKLKLYLESPQEGAPPKNPMLVALGNISIEEYVFGVVERIKSTELEQALLVIPFSRVVTLLNFLNKWAKMGWNIPLTCRILFYLLKVHHNQIVSNRIMRPVLVSLQMSLREVLTKNKDTIGYNLAAMKYIKREHEARSVMDF
ncbi:WD40-repeat-containing domain protein [Paraphysoderma sedebokerense]|nr:WD40-repeat-containing domain protein [Paraphysoderma sedebokerense]